jgi:hypothetical protein
MMIIIVVEQTRAPYVSSASDVGRQQDLVPIRERDHLGLLIAGHADMRISTTHEINTIL